MYHRKFDDVFIVSPSHAKMGINVKPENTTASFSLDWLFHKFETINEKQMERVFGHRMNRSTKDKSNAVGKIFAQGEVMGDSRSRFLLSDAFTGTGLRSASQTAKPLTAREIAMMEEVSGTKAL